MIRCKRDFEPYFCKVRRGYEICFQMMSVRANRVMRNQCITNSSKSIALLMCHRMLPVAQLPHASTSSVRREKIWSAVCVHVKHIVEFSDRYFAVAYGQRYKFMWFLSSTIHDYLISLKLQQFKPLSLVLVSLFFMKISAFLELSFSNIITH